MIETERLSLRKPRLEDAAALDEPVESLERWLAEWEANGLGDFTVRRGRDVVGRVGFHVWDRRTWTLAPFADAGERAEAELGWTLVPQQRGRGYATEAARAARDWASRERVISLIEPANEGSARVARRLDAEPTERVTVLGAECVVWVHPR